MHRVAPINASPAVTAVSWEDIVFADIKSMRERDGYKELFKKYISDNDKIDSNFVDKHYSFFCQWELDAIAATKQLDEDFLEKYFGALDKYKISRYQCFSEGFFMKHYSQLDAKVVLTQGKNQWRKSGKRSKQLDVFLRLKGVRL